jgi:Flp pilus assembly protein TadD
MYHLAYLRASVHLLRGELLLKAQASPALAVAEFSEACRLTPDSAEAQYDLGNAYARVKSYDEALRTYAVVEKLSPNYARLHFNKGTVLLLAGRYAEARRELKRAYDLDGLPDTRLRLQYADTRLK